MTKMQDFGEVGLFLLAFFLLSNYSAVATETNFDVTKHLVHSYDTKDGCQAAVFDDLFTDELLEQLRIAAFHFSIWNYHDKLGDVDKSNLLWRSEMQLEFFSKTYLWEAMSRAVSGVTHKTLYPFSVMGTITRRFEPLVLEETTSDDFMLMLFLSDINWKKNDYGNLSLYSRHRNGSVSSILWTAHPQSGRVTFWNGTIPHMYHPPSIAQVFSGLILLVQATDSKEKYEYELEKSKKRLLETENIFFKSEVFPTLPGIIPKYDLDKHLTRKFYDGEGRPVAVYDDLFTKEQLDILYQFLTTVKGKLRFADTDVTLPEDGDNVNWIKMFTVDSFLPSNVWDVVSQVAQHISNNRTEWYPYDVSLNVIRNADHTHIHTDCEKFEDEFTFLLYMNPDWDVNKYGETVYFNEINDPITHLVGESTGNEQYEPIGAVTPKYGRVAIFRGIIPHSARPPSADVHNARYTFAVKVSKDKRTAMGKSLREIMEEFDEGLTIKESAILSMLYHTDIDASISDKLLYETLKDMQNKRVELMKTNLHDAKNFLLHNSHV
ncbi:uncharacterized protein LOC100373740 [Saccoglossus kowalevskii]|uniref:Uncharacterized protein LOC100373740 n=1 Tax=Saccoglossus kowalevskii TaxID=10224 RepID=A0ABM0GY16_SACKO|nr:PREDICTED: uncharacterized protein LOC100373740 [Saccoglossus kowalevskii]